MNRIYQGKVTAVEIPDFGYRLFRIGHSPTARVIGHRSLVIGYSPTARGEPN